MKILAVDLDDTVVVYHELLCEYINRTHGHCFKKEQFTSPRFEDVFGVSKSQMHAWCREFDHHQTRQNLPLIPGAKELLSILAERYFLHVVTNRPIEIQDATRKAIDTLLPGLIKETHFCTKNWGSTKVKAKNEVCRDIGAKIIMEDHVLNAEDCVKAGIHVCLMQQPWNQNHQFEWWLHPGSIISIRDWYDPKLKRYLL